MRGQRSIDGTNFQDVFQAQRGRLHHFCASLTYDSDAAEDLAQEAMFEAWRSLHTLRDPAAFEAWLFGIARNLCRRWLRREQRIQAHLVLPNAGEQDATRPDVHEIPAAVDLELELERDELATLLDRALALLPPHTRQVLIHKYVEETPQAEIAARLGVSEGAVAMRLQRGKLLFRRILETELRESAVAHGLVDVDEEVWAETSLWCPYCGQRRLQGRFNKRTDGVLFQLRCPAWCRGPVYFANSDGATFLPMLGHIKGYRPALTRITNWVNQYYRDGSAVHHSVMCVACGRPAGVELSLPDCVPPTLDTRGLHVRCPTCAEFPPPHECLTGLMLCLPQGQQFWKAHPRIRALPEREAEIDGSAALLISFASVTDTAQLDIAVSQATFQVLGVYNTARHS